MTDSLKDQLKVLLETHPELNGCKISFVGTDNFLIDKTNSNEADTGDEKIIEEISGPLSVEVIVGNSPKIEIRKSPVHGYGVFAKEDLAEGELIDQCRLLKLGHRANYNHDPVLKDYIWADRDNSIESKAHGNNIFIALGFGSMYNHSDSPNTKQWVNYNAGVMTVNTNRVIKKDEEIFVNYGKKYFLIRDFWKGVRKNQAFEKILEKRQK